MTGALKVYARANQGAVIVPFWESEVADNNSFEQWRDAGEKDALVRANARWKKLLAEYEAPPLDPAIDNELADFCARKKSAQSD